MFEKLDETIAESIRNQRMIYCERLRDNLEFVDSMARRLNVDCGFAFPRLAELILTDKLTTREKGIIALLVDDIKIEPPFEYPQLKNYFARLEVALWD